LKTVVFAYHDVGIVGLESLLENGFEILHVFSHEDNPDEKVWFGSVIAWARNAKIPVSCPHTVNDDDGIRLIKDMRPDVIFSFYYRNLICSEILSIPHGGAYNLHGSLLPQYRGRVPINWALVNGETITGVTLHHMVEKADAGDIVGQRAFAIDIDDTALMLYKKLCNESGTLLNELLPLIKAGKAPRIKQDLSYGTYYGKRTPADGLIDWRKSAKEIYNLVRAVTDPYPGAFCFLPTGEKVIVWWAVVSEDCKCEGEKIGEVIVSKNTVNVMTGNGMIELSDIEIAGNRLTKQEISNFFNDKEGTIIR